MKKSIFMISILFFLASGTGLFLTGCSQSSDKTYAVGKQSRCMTTVPTGRGPLRKVQCWE